MDNEKIYQSLADLTDDLLYFSETESEFSVYEIDNSNAEDIKGFMMEIVSHPEAVPEEEDAALFFEKTMKALDVDDEVMQRYRDRYIALYTFLREAFPAISVYRAGEIEQDIFIVCRSGAGASFLLHTMSVGT